MPHAIESDFRKIVIAELTSYGLSPEPNKKTDELFLELLHYRRRTITKRKRRVLESSEFLIPAEVELGYKQFKQKVIAGSDLNSHLSTLIEKLETRDHLLNDWGVHHFHMGVRVDSDRPKYSERTGYVLLAVVKPREFYSIGFWHHKFAEREVIERIISNWPSLTRNHLCNEIVGIENPNKSPEDLALERKHGIMSIQPAAGKFVFSPGGGFASTGDNLQDVELLDNTMRTLKMLSVQLTVLENILPKTGPYFFKLIEFSDAAIVIVETSSGQNYTFENGSLKALQPMMD
jgi:hypothetical protein